MNRSNLVAELAASAGMTRRAARETLDLLFGVGRQSGVDSASSAARRASFDQIIEQLIKDELLIEKEVRKERGPSTLRLFVKAMPNL